MPKFRIVKEEKQGKEDLYIIQRQFLPFYWIEITNKEEAISFLKQEIWKVNCDYENGKIGINKWSQRKRSLNDDLEKIQEPTRALQEKKQ